VSVLSETGPARVTKLDGGLVQVTQPLPWALDHVHCYGIPGDAGWTIVDTGLGTANTIERWRLVLEELGSPVACILVTHFHPDHLGAAASLAELVQPDAIVQGELDARIATATWGNAADVAAFADHLLTHGLPEDVATASVSEESRLPVRTVAATRLVREGDELEIGRETWEVLELPGHADGHIALLGRTSRRLIGGDVLLEEITPNIGRWHDTAPDPLGRYFATLQRVAELTPEAVYPGHGPVIRDAPRRAREIRQHHDERLEVTRGALRAGVATTYEVMRHIWPATLGLHEQRFALVEAISHLEHLCVLGEAATPAPGRWAAI
jgi:glyoxylase-like metal-dependent hydrolase (beta-lactamase superfamily II)